MDDYTLTEIRKICDRNNTNQIILSLPNADGDTKSRVVIRFTDDCCEKCLSSLEDGDRLKCTLWDDSTYVDKDFLCKWFEDKKLIDVYKLRLKQLGDEQGCCKF